MIPETQKEQWQEFLETLHRISGFVFELKGNEISLLVPNTDPGNTVPLASLPISDPEKHEEIGKLYAYNESSNHENRKDPASIKEEAEQLLLHIKDSFEKDILLDRREKLAQENIILSQLPQANPNMVLIMDCSQEIVYLNPAARQWLADNRLSENEGIFQLLPDNFEDSLCSGCQQKQTFMRTLYYNNKSYDMKLRPLPDHSRCMITLTDVTELKKLNQEKELYYQAFQSARSSMMITDKDGFIRIINPAFERMYGFSQAEAAGKRPNILNPGKAVYNDLGYSDDDYERLFSSLWASIRDPHKGYWEGIIPNRRQDGNLIWVQLIISAIRNSKGEIVNYLGMPVDVTSSKEAEHTTLLEMYQAITDLAEQRDNETGNHIKRVGLFSRLLAEKAGKSSRFCDDIEIFAPMHDIGKVGISDTILLAPRKLSKEEFTIMKEHASIGFSILNGKPTLEMGAEIAHCHHERWDGAGYPRALKGEAIPIAARITAISDVYDALRSERPYKKGWPHEKAAAVIEEDSGTHFDPVLVRIFLDNQDLVQDLYLRYRD